MSADCLSAFGSVGQFVVVLSAFIYTLCNIDAWRKPTLAQRQADLAIEILSSALKLKDELLFIRRARGSSESVHSGSDDRVIAEQRLNELRDIEPVVDKLATSGIKQKIILADPLVDKAILSIIETEEELRRALDGLTQKGLGTESVLERQEVAFEVDRNTDRIRKKLRRSCDQLETSLKRWVDLK